MRPNRRIAKTLWFATLLAVLGAFRPGSAPAEIQYQLYKNFENFGILLFPKDNIFKELDDYIRSIRFDPVESGKAVMRSGSKGLNDTYMMPEAVQKKHSMDRFIVLQVIGERELLVGIFDPDWGLTLPSATFGLDEVRMKIPETLAVFRKSQRKKETRRRPAAPRKRGFYSDAAAGPGMPSAGSTPGPQRR